MNPFELVRVDDLAGATREGKANPGGVFKAAGIDLLDRLKERQFQPTALVDLLGMKKELGGIEVAADGSVSIGALTTLAQLATAKELADPAFAGLREAAGVAATPQIRNRATLGGNLLQQARCWYLRSAAFPCAHKGGETCFALYGENRYHSVLKHHDCVRVHPSNTAPALLALGAEVTIQHGDGERRIPLLELWPQPADAKGPDHTLAPGEVLTRIHLPKPAKNSRSAYLESREKLSFDWPTTAAAAWVELKDGKIVAARVCLGAVAPLPVPVAQAGELLAGQTPSVELFQTVAEAAFAGATPLYHNGYKIQVGKAIVVAALQQATGLSE